MVFFFFLEFVKLNFIILKIFKGIIVKRRYINSIGKMLLQLEEFVFFPFVFVYNKA